MQLCWVRWVMKIKAGSFCGIAVFLVLGFLWSAPGGTSESRVKMLAKLSLEELIGLRVTSVLKTPRSWSTTPAAIHVVTREDIRRSGVDNVPDLLRTVPGVQVAELDKDIFAVSIRGFNDIHANKLLVMVDGRSVYNHIFSGVIWNQLPVFMEDIERIEVIRGPGSSVWGANAVNGVINIITRHSRAMSGMLLTGGFETPESTFGSVRCGFQLNDRAAARVYAGGLDHRQDHLTGPEIAVRTETLTTVGGGRFDWEFGDSDRFILDGAVLQNDSETIRKDSLTLQQEDKTIEAWAWHLLGRWQHQFSKHSKISWQIYFNKEERESDYLFETVDLDFQHDYGGLSRNLFSWGLGYRFIDDEMVKGLHGQYTFDPVHRTFHLSSFFAQDTVQILPDQLDLTVGSKFEHNDVTGFEFQPGIRFSFRPHQRHTLWGAVSRAVRTPSRIDRDASSLLRGPPPEQPIIGEIRGNRDFKSEGLIAYETGYRTRPVDQLGIDISLFYNDYDNLSTYKGQEPGSLILVNEMEGETHGLELSADFRPFDWWRMDGAWSFLSMAMRLKDPQAIDLAAYVEKTNAKHQLFLHSGLDIGPKVELDAWLRYVGEIVYLRPHFSLQIPKNQADKYIQFDLRLAWKPIQNLELSVIGRNLGGAHQEFSAYEVEESVIFKTIYKFGTVRQ